MIKIFSVFLYGYYARDAYVRLCKASDQCILILVSIQFTAITLVLVFN